MEAINSREKTLNKFLAKNGWGEADIVNLAGDASFRHYKRLKMNQKRAVLMDAPPPKEDVRPFVNIAKFLKKHGYSSPKILAEDKENGFLLLEDLGDDRFTRVLNSETLLQDIPSEEEMYRLAIDVLADLHKCPLPKNVPEYTEKLLMTECGLLTEWYIPLITGKDCSKTEAKQYSDIWKEILPNSDLKPHVLVLRDYHADNLMWMPEKRGFKKVGLLDFQDAVIGSRTYDLVSLLEDARRDVSPALARKMISYYLGKFPATNRENFNSSYAILGAQRNCKILGIFARLALRDNKHAYLSFLPRVWKYLEHDLNHPDLKKIKTWLDKNVPAAKRTKPPSIS